jgi:hypothetical protein
MVYVITRPGVTGGRRSEQWQIRASAFIAAAAAAGTTAGAGLGILGGRVPERWLDLVLVCLGLAAAILGFSALAKPSISPVQCDRETPIRWKLGGPLWWAIRNGWSIGVGATTRIGFWSWYVVPVMSFLAADPLLGIAIYGTYATVRASLVVPMTKGEAKRAAGNSSVRWSAEAALARRPLVQTTTTGYLIFIGLTAVLVSAF